MAKFEIRLAHAAERKMLEDLQRRASSALPDYRDQIAAHPDAIDLPLEHFECGEVLVATVDGIPIGFGVVLSDNGRAELDGLFVHPDHWRRGIGRALIDAATHQARNQGLTIMVVTASPSAREFYESCGFSVEGEAETRFGPALRMSR